MSKKPTNRADRLRVLIVDTGRKLQVVCGAPNARRYEGHLRADGSFIPGGRTLKGCDPRGIRRYDGVEREWAVRRSCGIIEVDRASRSAPFAEVYRLNDIVFDIAVTPVRAVRRYPRYRARLAAGLNSSTATKSLSKDVANPVSVKLVDAEGARVPRPLHRGVKNAHRRKRLRTSSSRSLRPSLRWWM